MPAPEPTPPKSKEQITFESLSDDVEKLNQAKAEIANAGKVTEQSLRKFL